MFEKIGVPQPITVLNTCCICGITSTVMINGKLYCQNCIPKEAINLDEQEKDCI